ncbi:MAG: pyridoxamine 5'-phosphate oxidase family protein [Candidatus Omnitrophica bacterium]|nr:pyridoxamine 5'-phosphate oxidase family protein [Candidatus Omnitrophota bacterium]
MTKIPYGVKYLLDKHHFAVVSSHDNSGVIHTSAKGIIRVDPKGKIFILDIYKNCTYRNLKQNPHITLTVIDEHKYKGYSIEGKARIVKEGKIPKKTLDVWHEKLAKRIAKRVIRHVKEEESSDKGIPEARFPFPKYLIEMSVNTIVDLAPHKLRTK